MYFIFDIIIFHIDIVPFIYIYLYYIIIYNDYIRDKDYRMYYIIIDIYFLCVFWVGLWDQGFIGSLFVISFLCFVFWVYPYYIRIMILML